MIQRHDEDLLFSVRKCSLIYPYGQYDLIHLAGSAIQHYGFQRSASNYLVKLLHSLVSNRLSQMYFILFLKSIQQNGTRNRFVSIEENIEVVVDLNIIDKLCFTH